MTQMKAYNTPYKGTIDNLQMLETTQFTPQQSSFTSDKVDYKVKTFKLMKQLAETQVLNKKLQSQIRHLEKETEAFRNQFDKLFKLFGVKNLDQASRKVQLLLDSDRNIGNNPKLQQWQNIIKEYKKIINAQQYKYIKLEQQYKISEVKLKRVEKERENGSGSGSKDRETKPEQIEKNQEEKPSKMAEELAIKDKQIKSLEEEVNILKNQYKQAIMQKDSLKDMFQQLQNKYNLEIEHFQEMQKHVEDRLVEVEREMTFYRHERQQHLEKIQLMKKEIDLKNQRAYFSFGGVQHLAIQTDQQQEVPQFNNECMEISIKTLLQQNERLKNTLLVLYTKKIDDQLPKQIELQLKILLNMRDNSLKIDKSTTDSDSKNKRLESESHQQSQPEPTFNYQSQHSSQRQPIQQQFEQQQLRVQVNGRQVEIL